MTTETAHSISGRVKTVQAAITAACTRAGRAPDTVTLVAVSKQHSAAEIVEAVEVGVRHFGENRLEQALPKITEVQQLTDIPLTWHMIGQVQDRKVRHVVVGFDILHALDSVRLAQRLSQFATQRTRVLDVLLEINVSGEASKSGWHADRWQEDAAQRRAVWDAVTQVIALPGVNVRGLMTMAPIVAEMEAARPVFVALRELRDALAADFPTATWDDLSMGMTDDYPVAVEEGATLVRVGRAIFGPR
ncbi:MAG: YggS family pyridoxal phosphate-dependent enzyme [Anaerolineae bacterium]|nr:YggS family pyridoxal phosphate-dependent enzyme [Anaerolineae bacterium]